MSLPLIGDLDILGLQHTSADPAAGPHAAAAQERRPRRPLDRVTKFSDLARQNLDFALPLLGAVAAPI